MVETHFIKVRGVENNITIDLPLDDDNTLSLEVLLSQFPYANGLKSVNKTKDKIRTVRKVNGKFYLSQYLKLNEFAFLVNCPPGKKRTLMEFEQTGVKHKSKESIQSIHCRFPYTFDLVVLGLSYDTTEEGLAVYLRRFGELLFCKLTLDDISNESRGKAFFRFKDIQSQNSCLSAIHMLDKTKIVIKVPTEKIYFKDNEAFSIYLFHIGNTISREDLRAYFSQFGLITNVFRPYDGRNFALVTFTDKSSADRALAAGRYHSFNGIRMTIQEPNPKFHSPNGFKPKLNIDTSKPNAGLKRNFEVDSVTAQPVMTKHAKMVTSLDVAGNLEKVIPMTQPPPFKIQVNLLTPPLNHSSFLPSIPASTSGSNASVKCHTTQNSGKIPPPSTSQYPHVVCSASSSFTTHPPAVNHPSTASTHFSILPHNNSYNHSAKTNASSTQSTIKTVEEQNQLNSLVNEFIQEIKMNLNKLSQV